MHKLPKPADNFIIFLESFVLHWFLELFQVDSRDAADQYF